MQNSSVVSGFDSGDYLLHDRCCSLRTDRAFASQQVIERFALNVFHDEEEHAVTALAEIVHVDNVGMTNRCGRARLTLEAGDCFAFLKILKKELCTDATTLQRFIDEARVVNEIGHPNIVDVFAFGELPDGRSYFVMELLTGESLRTRLARGR